MNSYLVIFLSLFFTLSKSSDVIVLNDVDFNTRLSEHELVLVKFYAAGCEECEELEPEFEKAAAALKSHDPPVVFAEIDCTDVGKETCSTHSVTSHPTLTVFRRGSKAFDYEGPRDADGMIRHVKAKVRPLTRELMTADDVEKFINNIEHSIIGFFEKKDSVIYERYEMFASTLMENFRFAHTFNETVLEKYGYTNTFLIFRPPCMQTKLEPDRIEYAGMYNPYRMRDWVIANFGGLVAYRTSSNVDFFRNPLVVAYYNIDYVKNAKAANYWRNRVMQVAERFSDVGQNVTFAISNADEFKHELAEYQLKFSGDKPLVVGRDIADRKFVMKDEFSVEALETFVGQMMSGKLTTSEQVSADSHVKVVVAETFDSIVNDRTKDVLIDFYAPWSGHCKHLAPTYEELARKLKDEENIVIAKMDGTVGNIPKPYELPGFPAIFFVPMMSKDKPQRYDGERDVESFIKFLAQESTLPLKGYERDGTELGVKTEL